MKNQSDVAYQLSDRTGHVESCDVVFARSVREARRFGYIDRVDYVDLEARRVPKLDVFARYPFALTLRAKLVHGWWQECGGCGKRVTLGEGWIADRGKVVTVDAAYCNALCQAKDDGYRRGLAFARAEAHAVGVAARKRWPEAVLCGGDGGYYRPPHNTPHPPDGFRLSVRLYFPKRGLYATWVEGDADLTAIDFEDLARGVVTANYARMRVALRNLRGRRG